MKKKLYDRIRTRERERERERERVLGTLEKDVHDQEFEGGLSVGQLPSDTDSFTFFECIEFKIHGNSC
jgi:hypothetical protein